MSEMITRRGVVKHVLDKMQDVDWDYFINMEIDRDALENSIVKELDEKYPE